MSVFISKVCRFDYPRCVFCLKRFYQSRVELDMQPKTRNSLNLAISQAEKVVGYPTSFLNLRWLLSEEIANFALYIRKLLVTNHPLLSTARKLVLGDNMPAWGLIVLLISKTGGMNRPYKESEQDANSGILHSQRALAEVTEMIRTSNAIHRSIYNVRDTELDKGNLQSGNRVALLSGDYLLSTSFHQLACLRNQTLNELMASSLRDLAEAEFIGDHDEQNVPLPSRPAEHGNEVEVPNLFGVEPYDAKEFLGHAEAEWTIRNVLSGGSLLGKSCQSALMLSGHSSNTQQKGFTFGKHLALAWQARLDGVQFLSDDPNATFSLISAPVLFQLQHNRDLYDTILREAKNGVKNANYAGLYKSIREGVALERTKVLVDKHVGLASEALEDFPDSDAKGALRNIISVMPSPSKG